MDSQWLIEMLIVAPPLLLSLTVHEYAHARTALAFGDPTARNLGRVSLNPLVHLDPLGTICLLFSQFIGWAKPVPVNSANLYPPRLGNAAVSLAGPMSNIFLAIMAALALKIMLPIFAASEALQSSLVALILMEMLKVMMLANIGLFVFNLIPLFPLDGHHILREALPPRLHYGYMHWQMRYGMGILAALILLPQLMSMIGHPINSPTRILYRFVSGLMINAFGLHNLP